MARGMCLRDSSATGFTTLSGSVPSSLRSSSSSSVGSLSQPQNSTLNSGYGERPSVLLTPSHFYKLILILGAYFSDLEFCCGSRW